MSPFILDIAQLSQGATHARLEGAAAAAGLEDGGWVGLITGDLTAQRNGDRISIRGQIHATASQECVRCLRRFETPLEVSFEVFAERSGSGSRRDEEALERDDYMVFHDGRRLDLADEVRESLLLELPMTPRCRDDCQGLCPRCGADLNAGPCACPEQLSLR